MGHDANVYLCMNVGDKMYCRLVKKATHEAEGAFRLAAMKAESVRSGVKQNELHSGGITRKDSKPSGAIEV